MCRKRSFKREVICNTINFLQGLNCNFEKLPIHCNVSICKSIRQGLKKYSYTYTMHEIDILKAIPELKPKWYRLRTWWYGGYWFKTGTKVELSEEEFKKAIDIRIEYLRKTLEKI